MKSLLFAGLAVVASSGLVRGQAMFIGQGSTPPGDYLRGVGVAAWGMGQYNLNTARADQIEVGNAITLDSYLRKVHAQELADNARTIRIRIANDIKNYNAVRERVLERPEGLDILKGDALNAKLRAMNEGANRDETFHSFPIPLSTSVVRRIAFKIGKEGSVLSMARLLRERSVDWPPVFQDKSYDGERAEYSAAMSAVLGEHLEGKVSAKALSRVDRAVETLKRKFDAQDALARKNDIEDKELEVRGFQLARPLIDELFKTCQMLRSSTFQKALIELESYDGTTVDDLRKFMIGHHLSFAVSDEREERMACLEVFAALQAQDVILKQQREAAK
jgi:hypothetical protein